MVMDIVHKLKYVIEFKNPVDYFNVILQKQIDLRLKFDGNEECITIFDYDSDNKRFEDTKFFSKYKNVFNNNYFLGQCSYLQFYDNPDKYSILKNKYSRLKKECELGPIVTGRTPQILISDDDNQQLASYEEFEFKIDVMLEEFKLFCNFFEFNEDEKKIISSIIEDTNLKSNIKFMGWEDYWIVW